MAAPLIAGVLGMALLSGCGTDASAAPVAKPSPPAAYPTSTTFTSVLQMKFPDDAYEPNAAQSAEIEYLNLRLTQQCMKGFGFDYLPTLSATVISQGTKVNDEVRTRLYGISDATAAAAYGFHVPSWVSGTTSPQTVAQLPAAERAVLDGQGAKSYDGKAVPADGCVGRTADLLSAAGVSGTDLRQGGSSGDDAASLPHTIELNAFQAAQSDPRVLAVFAKWSACMSGFGYHYGTPFAAAGDTRWTNAAAASPAEIQAAQHDIACKLRVNLLDVEYSVESGYEAAAIAKNAQTMAEAKTELSTEITGLNRLMKEYAE